MKLFSKTKQWYEQLVDQIERDEAIVAEQRELIHTDAIPVLHFMEGDGVLD